MLRILATGDDFLQSIINYILEKYAFFIIVALLILFGIIFSYHSSFKLHELLVVLIAVATAFIAIITFVANHKTATIRHYADHEASLLNQEQSNYETIATVQKEGYSKLNINAGDFHSYGVLAHRSLKICSEIYEEKLWKNTIRNHFTPLFERCRHLHWDWFRDNISLFDKNFIKYMKSAK